MGYINPFISVCGQPELNVNKTKHYSSEMKGDIKLCFSSLRVVTLPFFFFRLVKVIF